MVHLKNVTEGNKTMAVLLVYICLEIKYNFFMFLPARFLFAFF